MRSGRAVVGLDVVNHTLPRRAVLTTFDVDGNLSPCSHLHTNSLPLRSTSRYTSPCCRSPAEEGIHTSIIGDNQSQESCLACSSLDVMGHPHQEPIANPNLPPLSPPSAAQQWCRDCQHQEYGPPCVCSAPDDEKDDESFNEADGLLEEFWRRSVVAARGRDSHEELLIPKHCYNNPYEQFMLMQEHPSVPSALVRSNSDCTVSI